MRIGTEYSPANESGYMWNDPAFAIKWPIETPTISERDKLWPLFAANQTDKVLQSGS